MEMGLIAGVVVDLNLAEWHLVEHSDFFKLQIEPGLHIEESK